MEQIKPNVPFQMIASISSNRGIGYNNSLLFSCSEDMKFFKEKTKFNVVIMGRGTWGSLPKHPLPDRANIVLSSTLETEGALVVPDVSSLIRFLNNQFPNEKPFVIGGETVFKELLPFTDKIYLTEFEVECLADRFFPELSEEWVLEERGNLLEENGLKFRINTYSRSLV